MFAYYNRTVDVGSGLLYADGISPPPGCLMGTVLRVTVGFIASDFGFGLPQGRLAALESPRSSAVVFSDGPVWYSCPQ